MGFRKGDRVHHRANSQYLGTVIKGSYDEFGIVDVQLDVGKVICYAVKDVVKLKKSSEIVIGKEIKCCPYCGSEEYYIKQSFKGTCNYYVRFDGEEADNTNMHDNVKYTNTNKYAWCNECNKRLFKLEE